MFRIASIDMNFTEYMIKISPNLLQSKPICASILVLRLALRVCAPLSTTLKTEVTKVLDYVLR